MLYAFGRHMVIVIDQNTASDGGDRDWLVEQIGLITDIVVGNLDMDPTRTL